MSDTILVKPEQKHSFLSLYNEWFEENNPKEPNTLIQIIGMPAEGPPRTVNNITYVSFHGAPKEFADYLREKKFDFELAE